MKLCDLASNGGRRGWGGVMLGAVLLASACLVGPALAQERVTVGLAVYADSFHVAQGRIDIRFDAESFTIATASESTGLFGLFFPWDSRSRTLGSVRDGLVLPVRHETDGAYVSEAREVRIGFNGRAVRLERLLPSPEEDEREPVPAALMAGSLDPLSASLQAALAIPADLSACPTESREVFDGRRLLRVRLLNTDNTPPLSDERGLPITWPTLKCELKTEEIAGRWKGERKNSGGLFARRAEAAPVPTHVFFARPYAHLAPIPVRVERRGGWSIVAVITEMADRPEAVTTLADSRAF